MSLRYLVKRTRLVGLFAFLSAGAALAQDPKFFRIVAASARAHAVSTSMLIVALVAALTLSFALIRTTLDSRYATSRHAVGASVVFLSIFVAASLIGFGARVLLFSETPSPQSQRLETYDLLVATILLTIGGVGVAALYNLLFVQKADYTKLRAEVRALLAVIDGMRDTFSRRGYLAASDAEALQRVSIAARSTADDLVKIEVPAYAAYVDVTFARPLATLADAADAPGVLESPESFLRACGLIEPASPDSQAVTKAFRMLQNRR